MDVLARSKPQHGESASAGSSAVNRASSSSDLSLEPGSSQMDVDEREHEVRSIPFPHELSIELKL